MGEVTYPITLTFIKCSILCLFLRIFGTVKKSFRVATYTILGLAIAWGISVSITAAFQCKPIAAAWNPDITSKHCINIRDYFVSTSSLNVVIDFAILILPLPPLWRLQLATSRKVTISSIFLLGIL